MRISDWSSDVCSSDLRSARPTGADDENGMDRNMGYRVVVAGATGNVGREMLNILAEREFPADEIAVLASSRSAGERSEERRVGKEGVSTCRSRWSPVH